ncbi:helix-turn-helix transcriptional regulator [Aestuariimicrobium sp. Y1814]|uniref:helix-turn-helix transcriptional regulator n=1 Tax=Aestuariimicrobium sp. Y1814 TaxID=3418742 RepID=UPI003DA74283
MYPTGSAGGPSEGSDAVTALPPDAAAIAGAIRAARKGRGWTQTDLGKRAGVSRPTVARVERGDSVSSKTLMKIASALDLRLGLQS